MGLVGNRGGLLSERPCRAAGRVGALRQKPHLDGLGPVAIALGPGVLAVLCPTEPAEVLGVHSVPDVVLLRELAGKGEPDGLHPLGAAGGARHLAGAHGRHPAHVLDVRLAPEVAGEALGVH